MALLQHHHLLSQIAGHDPDVLKLTPPLLAGEAEIDQIVTALDAILTGCRQVSGPIWRMTADLLK